MLENEKIEEQGFIPHKMNPEVKALWTTALRSGEYTQTKQALKTDEGHCCLGVLCDLYLKHTGKGEWQFTTSCSPFSDGLSSASGTPPSSVCEWAGFRMFSRSYESNPRVISDAYNEQGLPDYEVTLASMNDMGATFAEIADIIEAQL